MIVMCWNVRGLGKAGERATVRKLVKKHKVDLLLLWETKVSSNVDHMIHNVWGS